MTLLLIIGGVALGVAMTIVRTLALEEVAGRIQHRARASVEKTIASMPEELQAEWGDEWRAELAALRGMPISSIAFARGLKGTVDELVAASALAPAGSGRAISSRTQLSGRERYLKRLLGWRPAGVTRRRLLWIATSINALIGVSFGVLTVFWPSVIPFDLAVGIAGAGAALSAITAALSGRS